MFNILELTMQKYLLLIGRIFLTLIFIMAGLGKVMDFAGTQQYMSAYGMPLTSFFLIVAFLIEILGSLSILLGWKAKWGALALIIFLIPTTLIFHTHFSDQVQMIMFLKNLGLLGGLLYIYVFGPGEISFDAKKKES